MSSSRGPALVRLALVALVLAAFAAALATPAQAGSKDAPEINDPAGDQTTTTVPVAGKGVPACAGVCPTLGAQMDLLKSWAFEPGDGLHIDVEIGSGAAAHSFGTETITVTLQVGATAYTATGTFQPGFPVGSGALAPGGVAAVVIVNSDGLLEFTIPYTNIGGPTAGTMLTYFVTLDVSQADTSTSFIQDRAPDDGYGLAYAMTAGGGNLTSNPNDTDGDGLNDTCEMKYYHSLNATNNSSADDDHDGYTNGQECAGGTDPTKADTDGDGCNDKADSAPNDPNKGCGQGNNGTSSSSSHSSTSSSSTTSHSSTSSTSADSSSSTGIHNLNDAVDALKSDIGYLGSSAGAFLAVLVLCILALAVRWSL